MEETINELKEKCYVTTSDVSHRFGCHKTLPEEALKMFLKGKEDLEVGDYVSATYALFYAKIIYDAHYGKLTNETGAVSFFCGKAHYYLSQEEMFDIEMKKELSEPTDSPLAVFDEGSTDTKVKGETSKFLKEAGFFPQEESIMEEEIMTKKWLSDFHRKLAWEFLEDAKLIFERQDTVEAELKFAETLQLIASMYRDNANYSSAIKEYKRSKKIFEKHLKPDDETFSETYLKMGIVYRDAQMYSEALKYLQKSKRMLEMECENLRNTTVDADKTCKPRVSYLTDLLSLLSDSHKVIEDTEKLMKKNEVMET